MHHVATVAQAAAIAVPQAGGGPDELHLFLVASSPPNDPTTLQQQCQQVVRQHLNPLFKVGKVTLCTALPRNASNKVMRRVLREEVLAHRAQHARL